MAKEPKLTAKYVTNMSSSKSGKYFIHTQTTVTVVWMYMKDIKSIYLLLLTHFRVVEELEPVPAAIEWEAGHTHWAGRQSVTRLMESTIYTHIHTYGQFEIAS